MEGNSVISLAFRFKLLQPHISLCLNIQKEDNSYIYPCVKSIVTKSNFFYRINVSKKMELMNGSSERKNE